MDKANYEISAAIPLDVSLGKKASMQDLALAVNTIDKSVGIDLNFVIDDPALTLTGAIALEGAGLQLSATMSGQ